MSIADKYFPDYEDRAKLADADNIQPEKPTQEQAATREEDTRLRQTMEENIQFPEFGMQVKIVRKSDIAKVRAEIERLEAVAKRSNNGAWEAINGNIASGMRHTLEILGIK